MPHPFHSLLAWHHEEGIENTLTFPLCAPPPPVQVSSPPSKQPLLDQLYQEILAFQGCALSQAAQHTVFADGNPEAKVMLVGEAPGAEEDRLGKPFVGMSGKLLDKMFSAIGLDRQTLYITNVVPWRPPFNRQPTSEEIASCLSFVERHIAIIQPKILVCVGGVACKALLRSTESISFLHQKALSYPSLSGEVPTFALYHPAYLLRSPAQKRVAWRQLIRLKAALQL